MKKFILLAVLLLTLAPCMAKTIFQPKDDVCSISMGKEVIKAEAFTVASLDQTVSTSLSSWDETKIIPFNIKGHLVIQDAILINSSSQSTLSKQIRIPWDNIEPISIGADYLKTYILKTSKEYTADKIILPDIS